ncbi:UDP-galactose transporter [Nowakowskiella sp. JEL0407]|nr:UDP-galactose transporter [Nowakowskiella sp. JEL0407]
MRSSLELLICVAGIYSCFLTWEICRQRVTKVKYGDAKFSYFLVLNSAQSITAAIVAFLYLYIHPLLIKSKKPAVQLIPATSSLLFGYFAVSLLQTVSQQVSFVAFKHLDYPTMILGKSCKLVPVLLMNLLFYRRSFPLSKYLLVALITAGVSIFTLYSNESKRSTGSTTWFGLSMLLTTLTMDGFTNASQDYIFRTNKVPGTHMMLFMNLCSSVYTLVYLFMDPFQTKELANATIFYIAHPQIGKDILIYSLTGAIGQCFIFHTLERFGSMSLVTVTVVRKMLSVLLSIFLFGIEINWVQWVAVAMVFTGIAGETYWKAAPPKITEKKEVSSSGRVEDVVLVNGSEPNGVKHRKGNGKVFKEEDVESPQSKKKN